jgi:hypothetical protein
VIHSASGDTLGNAIAFRLASTPAGTSATGFDAIFVIESHA